MFDLFLHPNAIPFTVALGVVVALTVVQVALSLLGGGTEIDADGDLEAGAAPGPLDWLMLGQLPLTVILTLGLAGFGLVGMLIQIIARSSLSPWLASVPALLGAVAAIRFIGGPLAKVLNSTQGHATKADALIGHEATIVLGTASIGSPSQARLKDAQGTTHYVLVEPLRPSDRFESGEIVVLAQRDGAKFRVVRDSVDLFDSTSSVGTTSSEGDDLRQSTGEP